MSSALLKLVERTKMNPEVTALIVKALINFSMAAGVIETFSRIVKKINAGPIPGTKKERLNRFLIIVGIGLLLLVLYVGGAVLIVLA